MSKLQDVWIAASKLGSGTRGMRADGRWNLPNEPMAWQSFGKAKPLKPTASNKRKCGFEHSKKKPPACKSAFQKILGNTILRSMRRGSPIKLNADRDKTWTGFTATRRQRIALISLAYKYDLPMDHLIGRGVDMLLATEGFPPEPSKQPKPQGAEHM